MVIRKIPHRRGQEIHDFWKNLKSEIRKACKGYGAKLKGNLKRRKLEIEEKLLQIDKDEENSILGGALIFNSK